MFTVMAPAVAGQPGISFAPIVADVKAGIEESLAHLEQALSPKTTKRVRRKSNTQEG